MYCLLVFLDHELIEHSDCAQERMLLRWPPKPAKQWLFGMTLGLQYIAQPYIDTIARSLLSGVHWKKQVKE